MDVFYHWNFARRHWQVLTTASISAVCADLSLIRHFFPHSGQYTNAMYNAHPSEDFAHPLTGEFCNR